MLCFFIVEFYLLFTVDVLCFQILFHLTDAAATSIYINGSRSYAPNSMWSIVEDVRVYLKYLIINTFLGLSDNLTHISPTNPFFC